MKGENRSRFAFLPALLSSPVIQAAVAEEVSRSGVTPQEAQHQVRRFLREIAATPSPATIRFAARCFSRLWPHLYEAIEVHRIDVAARIDPQARAVYIPAHRSHLDYLLLSFLLHDQGLRVPLVAAGINLKLPLVGALLRRCGAFFMHRSFKGEALYGAVFSEYLHLLQQEGAALEYFIEGGRSRSGYTLKPRTGLLGMSISSFLRDHARPLVFVPVYIGYEKLFEGESYLRELSGEAKQKESLWGLMQTLRRVRRIYGRVQVNFGEPLDLSTFLEQAGPGWQNTASDAWASSGRTLAAPLAQALATRINDAVVLGPVNLLALVLLATPTHRLDEAALHRRLEHYLTLCRALPYAPASIDCPLEARQIVACAERLGHLERRGASIGIPAGQAAVLAYFRNNVAHRFVLPALLARLTSKGRGLARQNLRQAACQHYERLRDTLFLHGDAAKVATAVESTIAVLLSRRLLRESGDGLLEAPQDGCQEFAELQELGALLPDELFSQDG